MKNPFNDNDLAAAFIFIISPFILLLLPFYLLGRVIRKIGLIKIDDNEDLK